MQKFGEKEVIRKNFSEKLTTVLGVAKLEKSSHGSLIGLCQAPSARDKNSQNKCNTTHEIVNWLGATEDCTKSSTLSTACKE